MHCAACVGLSSEDNMTVLISTLLEIETPQEMVQKCLDIALNFQNMLSVPQLFELIRKLTDERITEANVRFHIYCSLACLVSEDNIQQLYAAFRGTNADSASILTYIELTGVSICDLVDGIKQRREDIGIQRRRMAGVSMTISGARAALVALRAQNNSLSTNTNPIIAMMNQVFPMSHSQQEERNEARERRNLHYRQDLQEEVLRQMADLVDNEERSSTHNRDPQTRIQRIRQEHLLAKLERNLGRDKPALEAENCDQEDQPRCCVCLLNFPNVVLDCGDVGHQNTCVHCTITMVSSQDVSVCRCPVCNTEITGVTILAASDASRMIMP